MITIHGANKVKTFFCCTPTEYTQNKFNYGKLHDVTSLERTQLMVYYANRLSNLLFHQPIEDEVKNLAIHKTIAKRKVYILHWFYHEMIDILTFYGPNPVIPENTTTNCKPVSMFICSPTNINGIPFIHGYLNMYIRYIASYVHTNHNKEKFSAYELNELFNDLFPNQQKIGSKGSYNDLVDLQSFRIDDKFNVKTILENCILNKEYNWNIESDSVHNRFRWDISFDQDHFYTMPVPATLALQSVLKQKKVKSNVLNRHLRMTTNHQNKRSRISRKLIFIIWGATYHPCAFTSLH
eukprot:scaffold56312_cov69-Attheya_sp.AAC.1